MNEQQAWEAYQREAWETMRLFEDIHATPAARSAQMLKANAAHKVYMAAIQAPDAPLTVVEAQQNELVVHGVLLWCALLTFGGLALPDAIETGSVISIAASVISGATSLLLGATIVPMFRRYWRLKGGRS